jgi:RHS repeat-associated protein
MIDNASRLYKVTQGTSTLIGYDNANRRSTLTLTNGIVLTYGYDNDSRINSMSYQLGTTMVGSLSYGYDAAGRRTQVGGSLAATGFPNAVSSAAYDVANEVTGWNGTTIGYDANGNISNDGVASYTWNGRNQLISRGATSYQYDSFGRRTLNAAGNNLLYQGWNVAQELSGTTPVTNQIVGGIDEFFGTKSGATYNPITDGLGSVLALTNSSGAIKTQYGYDPFGNTTTAGASSTNVFQYTGRENDANGLYYYRARYYSPTVGRFISEDPLEFWGGGPNLYAYVANDPIGRYDPFGLCWIYKQSDGATYYQNDQTGQTTEVSAAGIGYSGYGYGWNDPESQSVGASDNVPNNYGPIPQGQYTIGPQGLHYSAKGSKLPASMRLTPDAGNTMFGRSGFLMHGDNNAHNNSASEGCIIMPLAVRNNIASSPDKCLQVVP